MIAWFLGRNDCGLNFGGQTTISIHTGKGRGRRVFVHRIIGGDC
jgi:hypothetical protein